jgi:transposase-like protein/IS1 family transposase
MKSLTCPNRHCPPSKNAGAGAIIRHGFYRTRSGKRRRYQCRTCGRTFCSTTRTPYYRLQHRHALFDEVASLSVEGLNKSAIARVKRIAWNTVHRWLERAAIWCRRFNNQKINRFSVVELQADEIKTIVARKKEPIWIFAVIEVWSRFWPSTVVGKRSYQNTLTLFRNVSSRMTLKQIPLIVTDGFGFYEKVIGRVFGSVCLHGQVIKTRRNDRIVKVERRAVLGDKWRLEQALRDSEDSVKLNTSFVERLNLTIRQGSAYLGRRTICHARWKKQLEDHLELLRCHYNFVRPHRALKFGREVRTPARQAGLTSRALTLRKIFSSRLFFVRSKDVLFTLFDSVSSVRVAAWRMALAALATLDDGSTDSERSYQRARR